MDSQNDNKNDPNSNRQEVSSSNYPTQTRFVNMDSFVSFIDKKTEQVATALYLVSDTMETTDPIRHRIREKSVELVSVGKSLDLLSAVEKHFEFHALKSLVKEVTSLLSISHIVGEISEMNKRILSSEGKKLIDAIDVVLTEEREHGFNNPTLMDDATSNFMLNTFGPDTTESQYGTPSQKIEQANVAGRDTLSQSVTKAPQNDIISIGHPKQTHKTDRSQNDIAVHHIRRQSIIKIISQNKSATLADIKAIIPDVSEKTIQRELMSLITDGVVLKIGDKRWAKYSLK